MNTILIQSELPFAVEKRPDGDRDGLLSLCLNIHLIIFFNATYGLFFVFLLAIVVCAFMAFNFSPKSLLIYMAMSGLFISISAAIVSAILTVAVIRAGKDWRQRVAWLPYSLKTMQSRHLIFILGGLACSLAIFLFNASVFQTVATDEHCPIAIYILLIGFVAIILPPIEELLFRGWIYTNLRKNFGVYVALVASSLINVAVFLPGSDFHVVYLLPLAFALGAIREITGSTKASLAAHISFSVFIHILESLFVGP